MKASMSSPRTFAAHAGFALAACLLLLSPMLLTNRSFGPDWTNHLWALSTQGDAISGGGPSLYFHVDILGVFYPFYAFYGGSLYAIGGGLSLVFGSAVTAYLVMWLLGFLMAYGGLLWLSFQAGVRGWQAHAAPLVMVTSAYYLTDAYARGTWPELLAVSALPLVLASAVWMLRSPRLGFWPAAAFVFATVIFTGSHNISLLWGTITVGALAAVALATVPAFRKFPLGRIAFVLGLGLLAVAVNAWFLLADIAYSGRTGVAAALTLVAASDIFATPANVFLPLRHTPAASSTPGLATQLPTLIGLWALVVAAASFRFGFNHRLRQIAVGLTGVMAVLIGLLILKQPWEHAPHVFVLIQYTYRLESFIVIVLALLVVVLLRVIALWGSRSPGWTRGLKAGLAVLLIIGFGQALVQAWDVPSHLGRARAEAATGPHHLPPNWFPWPDYGDKQAKQVEGKFPNVTLDPTKVKDSRLQQTVRIAPNSIALVTNITGGDYLVRVSGAQSIGRRFAGFRVIRPRPGAATVTLRVQRASTWPVVLGRWISIAALVVLLTLALAWGYRSVAGRKRTRR
jgi:hypothetical protein